MPVETSGNNIFAPIKGTWIANTPAEQLRQEFIYRLIDDYGYSAEQMEQEQVIAPLEKGRGNSWADIVVWSSEEDKQLGHSPLIVVECKTYRTPVYEEDYFQGANYANWSGSAIFVATNPVETRIFNVKHNDNTVSLIEITALPTSAVASNRAELGYLLGQKKDHSKIELGNALFKSLTIIRNNERISPETAIGELTRILYTHVNDKMKAQISIDREIFPADTTPISDSTIQQVIEILKPFDLSHSLANKNEAAFDVFLDRTFKGNLGRLFTPKVLVDYMVEILSPHEGESVADPCCGSGGFLISSIQHIGLGIQKGIQEEKEKIKAGYFHNNFDLLDKKEQEEIIQLVNTQLAILNSELDPSNPESRVHRMLATNFTGSDTNPTMTAIANLNILLHNAETAWIDCRNGLFPSVKMQDGHFDIVFADPPRGPLPDKNDRKLADLYDQKMLGNSIEGLFVDKCLRLLKPGGRMAMILPENILSNAKFEKLREFVENRAKIINITTIPDSLLLSSGTTRKCGMLFFKKFTNVEQEQFDNLRTNITKRADEANQEQMATLKKALKGASTKEEAKLFKAQIARLIKDKEDWVRTEIKTKFTYDIPVFDVRMSQNDLTESFGDQLRSVIAKYKEYRIKNNLWQPSATDVHYEIINDRIQRNIASAETDIFYDTRNSPSQ